MQTRPNRSVEKYKTKVAIYLTHLESHQLDNICLTTGKISHAP